MIYSFEDFELDSDQQELRLNGTPQKMEPQVFALITTFVTNPDRLLSKDELIEKVWDGRFVSDAAIDSRIRSARIALNDSGKEQRLIKTIHSRGFRFVGKIASDAKEVLPEAAPAVTATTVAETEKPNRSKFFVLGAIVIAALLVAVLVKPFLMPGDETDTGTAETENYRASIAVLPFADMSAAGDQKYLGDGLAEELLNVLVGVEGLKVSSRTSAFIFGEQKAKISEIGKALGVDHVLEGSVRQAGDTIRVTAQLIDVHSDSHIWSKTYDRPLDAENILKVQDEIAGAIVTELMGKLNIPGLAAAPRIASAEAYEHYLRAKAFMREVTPESLKLAIEQFEKAIAQDPEYVAAYAGLTLTYEHAGFYAGMPDIEVLKGMEENVAKALKLAPESADALMAAAILAEHKVESEKALDLYQRAIAIEPKNADALKGRADIYSYLGQFDKSLESYELARVYDPLSPPILANIASLKRRTGDIEGALEVARNNLKWNANAAAALNMLSSLEMEGGNYAKAHRLLLKAAQSNPEEYNVQFDLSDLYLNIGMDAAAQRIARRPETKARIEALLGNRAAALKLLTPNADDDDTVYVHYLLQDYAKPYPNYRKNTAEYDLTGQSDIGLDELVWISEYVYVLEKSDDPDWKILLEKLEKKMGNRTPSDANTRALSLGGAAMRMLRDDQKGALEWIDSALDNGHAFLRLTNEPVFAPLAKNPAYPSRLKRMKANATKHRKAITKQLDPKRT